MRPSRRPLGLLLLVAAALAATAAVPPAAQAEDPSAPTQQVVVRAPGGGALQAVEVTAAELAALEADPRLGPVLTRGRTAQAELAQSVPKIGAPTLWAGGHRGAGAVIAVIDTGVSPSFGGTLVGQACFAATQGATSLDGHCGTEEDATQAFDQTCFDLGVCQPGDPTTPLDAAAARPCPEPSDPRGCAHGSAVAAVAARHEPTPGVAPDAGVYAVRVFDPHGTSADLIDILLGLDHVRQMFDAGLPVVAVNLSVATTTTFGQACDSSPSFPDAPEFRQLFDELLDRGIPTLVSSGNDGKVGGIGLPACVSSAVSVGGSDLDDELADFGNRGPTLDFVAPAADEGNGRAIQGMDIPGSGAGPWAGTSFSAPHAAGAYAVLRGQYPKASVGQLTAFLRETGVPITDPATGASYRRIALRPAAQALRAQVLFPAALPGLGGTARSGIGDFDGDGRADVLAHGPGAAPDRISYGTESWRLEAGALASTGSYVPLVGNFRGAADGPDDILWYAPGPAADSLSVGDESRSLRTVPVSIGGTYAPVVGDYDGDGFDDVLWYAPGAAGDSLWFGGPSAFTPRSISVTGRYRVAVGDFDGDGRDDLVFHGPGSAPDTLYRGTVARGQWTTRPLAMSGTFTLRPGDFDGDGDDDLLLYQPGAATDSIWRGGPGGAFSPQAVSVQGTYQPSVGDLDGDGRDDILWYAPGVAGDSAWFGRSSGAPLARPLSVSGTYVPLLGDLDGAAGDEIVWFPPTSAATPVWWSHRE